MPVWAKEKEKEKITYLSPGGACTPNGASTLGLPTGILTGVGWDALLAAMAASLAATASCTSGLRWMMSSRTGPSSSVRSVWCNLGQIVMLAP